MSSLGSELHESAAPLSDIAAMDAVALSATIHSRNVSCVEVMTAYLDHIESLNPKVNAIVALQDRAALLGQARERDVQLARGAPMGPLHGFPHAVKDLQPVKGIRSTWGSPILKDFVPAADSVMVERLRQAGAIMIGKTNTPEFGLGSHTYNSVYGATRNPYDPSRSAGGSSGGAAVALALRMLPVADGSDYGGSLRNPAGWNNVFGFRTSYGRVPNDGFEVWLPTLSVLGPMARTVTDLAMLLSVQAGFDPRAPLSMDDDTTIFQQRLDKDSKARASPGSATSKAIRRASRACSMSATTRSRSSNRSAASWRRRSRTILWRPCGARYSAYVAGTPAALCWRITTIRPNAL